MPHAETFAVPIVFGAPKFRDPACAEIARTQGAVSAWQAALRSNPPAGLLQVDGAFAVALPLEAGRVLLAVDRFAIQSLCWTVRNGVLRYAERADDLADESSPIDPQAIFDYLYFHVIPSPRTIFKGVFRLPPGHYALFDQGQMTIAPYWVPTFKEQPGKANFGELKDEFRVLLKQATAEQLDAGKAACFLSGGTDSSTVAGMIVQATGKAPSAYSIGFEAEGYDEMAYARIAAKRFGVTHHEYYVTPDDLVRSIPDVAAHYDQPFGNSSAVPAYYCARMARDDGVTRILAGDGGDELFGGNSRYALQRVFGWYDNVPRPVRGVMGPVFSSRLISGLPLLRKGTGYIRQAKTPLPDRLQNFNLLLRLGVGEVFTPAFLQQVDMQEPIAQQRAVWSQAKANNALDRNLAFDWRYTLAENDLPKVCGTTRLAGIEVGFPLLDQRLLDFSMRLPTNYKLKGLKLRWFFKEALRGFLPDEIITKKKHGFGLPFGVWSTRHERLRALASDSLGSLSTRGFIQPSFVKSLLDQRTSEHAGYYGEMVWVLMMLEQWLRQHAPDFTFKV